MDSHFSYTQVPETPNGIRLLMGLKLHRDPIVDQIVFSFSDGTKKRISKRLLQEKVPELLAFLGVNPQNPPSVIVVNQCRPTVFHLVLKHVFTNAKVKVQSENFYAFIDLVHRAEIATLKLLYPQLKFVGVERALSALDSCLKDEFVSKEIKEKAIAQVTVRASRIFESMEFLNISETLLLTLLKEDDLFLSEVDLFKYASRWVNHKEERKGSIAKINALIRYRLMSSSEFFQVLALDSTFFTPQSVQAYSYEILNGPNKVFHQPLRSKNSSANILAKAYWRADLDRSNQMLRCSWRTSWAIPDSLIREMTSNLNQWIFSPQICLYKNKRIGVIQFGLAKVQEGLVAFRILYYREENQSYLFYHWKDSEVKLTLNYHQEPSKVFEDYPVFDRANQGALVGFSNEILKHSSDLEKKYLDISIT
jgi:hypothetical protein